MRCPDCKHILRTFEYTSYQGGLTLNLTMCSYCNGFWLDSPTVNSLTFEDALNLDKSFKGPRFHYQSAKLCPDCQLPLKTMKEESIPIDTNIYICSKCFGKWFPKGELLKFKQAQQIKLKYYKEQHIPLKSIFAILLPLLILIPLVIYLKTTQKPQIYIEEPAKEIIVSPSPLLSPSPEATSSASPLPEINIKEEMEWPD